MVWYRVARSAGLTLIVARYTPPTTSPGFPGAGVSSEGHSVMRLSKGMTYSSALSAERMSFGVSPRALMSLNRSCLFLLVR